MEALAKLIPLLLTISLGGLVLAVGLHSRKGDLVYVLSRPALLLKAILAVIVIPPVAAAILVSLLPVAPVVKAGVMLMAISPVPPLVPGKELGMGARKEYAYGLYVAMALLTVISVPLVMSVISHLFGRDDSVSVASIARTVGLGVILPLAIGLLIGRNAPAFAERVWGIIYKLSMLLVLIAFIPIVVKVWGPMMSLVGDGTLAMMAAVTVIAMIGGHVLGGPDILDRATLATAASVRHPGIAISLAAANFADPRVTAAVLLFMLVGLVVAIPYKMWIKRQAPPVAA